MTWAVENITLIGRLKQLSITFAPAKQTHIIGPNGAGKSTLLQAVAGLLPVDSGRVTAQGTSLSSHGLAELAQMRGYHHQQNNLAFALSVQELMALFAEPVLSADGQLPHRLVTALDLTVLLSRNMRTLSGGEQQRVYLARAFLQVWPAIEQGAACLILDEPLQGLDIKHQHQLLGFCDWLTARGNTVILTSHDLSMTAQYADDVVILRQGELLAHGAVPVALTEATLAAAFDVSFVIRHHEKSTEIISQRPLETP